jgi:kynurenine formamidase
MRKSLVFCLAAAFALAICAGPAFAAVEWPDKWWPSKWGAGDEKGSFNTVTPKSIMKALKIPKKGKVYRLGMPYSQDMPLFGSRTYALHIPGLPVGGPYGDNQIVWNDEFICGELGQVGTQFDGPGHVGILCKDGVMRWYNGAELATGENTYGFKTMGVEKLGPCIARGVLIDMVGLLGRPMELGETIFSKHIKEACKKQGVALPGEGDAVLFNTGWGRHWEDPATFNAGCPGIGWEACKWLVKRNPSMLCADTWPVQQIPELIKVGGKWVKDEKGAFAIHCYMQPVHGIWFLENISTKVMDQMAADGVYEFLWIFVPVQFEGATGSPGDGIAIY